MVDWTAEAGERNASARPESAGIRSVFSAAYAGAATPFSWQVALAEDTWPDVLIAPTGSGKTAGVTLAWLSHRLLRPEFTPRRLVWCLPMRTLVEQTADAIKEWLKNLAISGIDPEGLLPRPKEVFVLMGGAFSDRWLEAPEAPAVIVGTQDMLLSRALMRGYASRRTIWPMQFGLLHQDTQWVYDEVQLMGAGRATSAQLEAFRCKENSRKPNGAPMLSRTCRSMWISATLEPEWLNTVDFDTPDRVLRVDSLAEKDARLRELVRATKKLIPSKIAPESAAETHMRAYLAKLAAAILDAHRTNHMTLVIVNQVSRAQKLYLAVKKRLSKMEHSPEVVLLHSRFRPAERNREMRKVLGRGYPSDLIVISTQAVEAGVDISAAVMFAELAPWASMVQRFGRANRRAEVEDGAEVYWIDILACVESDGSQSEKKVVDISRPYKASELRDARGKLTALVDAAPVHLPPSDDIDPPARVIRRKDLNDLFDTDPDLTGFDVDISPYIRDANDTDIRVFWRELPGSKDESPKAHADELCSVPIGQAKKWIDKRRKSGEPVFFLRDPQWRRDGHIGSSPPGWVPLAESPWPGLTILAAKRAGGYSEELGFTGRDTNVPSVVDPQVPLDLSESSINVSDGHDDDPESETGHPVALIDHLEHVTEEVAAMSARLGVDALYREALIRAARWHDLGKAHRVFQSTMRRGLDGKIFPETVLLAKTVNQNLRHDRAYFRHELASALAFLAHEDWSRDADLTAYLIAAHHGKVRMSIQALPLESAKIKGDSVPDRFARGVWEGDELPELQIGENEFWKGGNLTLSIIELGWDESTRESWTERTRDLLEQLGPFRLAFLETLLRIADWRASRKEELTEKEDD